MDRASASNDATWWRHSRLFEARSVVGAIAIVAIVAAFVLIVPVLEDNVEQSGGFDDSGRFIVDDYTTMLLAEGWRVDNQSDLFIILTDGTYQLVLAASVEEATSPEDALAAIHDAYLQDPANVVTDIVSFSTDAGAPAAEYRVVLAADASGNGGAFAAVSQNGRLLQPGVTGPPDLDDPFYDEFLDMVRSIEITAEPREASS